MDLSKSIEKYEYSVYGKVNIKGSHPKKVG
jgi:hypothetical protein